VNASCSIERIHINGQYFLSLSGSSGPLSKKRQITQDEAGVFPGDLICLGKRNAGVGLFYFSFEKNS